MSIRVNEVYRFTHRFSGRFGTGEAYSINGLNRQRLDGADVLVVDTTDGLRFSVEALDGTVFTVWGDELTDVAATEADRFAGHVPPPRRPILDGDWLLVLRAHEAAADSIAIEAEDRSPGSMTTPAYIAGYARAVADYAAYLRGEEISENLANLLG